MNHVIKFLLLTVSLLTMAAPAFCDTAEDYLNSGNVKRGQGDLDGPIADFTKAIELKPDYAEAYYNRASAKAAKSDLDGAIADYTKIIGFKPDYLDTYYNRGGCKRDKGDVDGAIADYDKAIELKPKASMAYFSRGDLRYALHDFTNALPDFRKVIQLETPYRGLDFEAHFRVWLIRTRLGEAEAATAELQKYLAGRTERYPDDWELKTGHFLAGQLAEPAFLAAAKSADTKTEAYLLCKAYFYAGSKRLFAGDKATAADYFQKSIATNEKDSSEYSAAVSEMKLLKAQKN